MNILRIISIAFVGTIFSMMIEDTKKEFSLFIILVTSLIISFEIAKDLYDVYNNSLDLIQSVNIDKNGFEIAIKASVIAYIATFSANMLRDMNKTSVASKIELFAKVSILILTMPLFNAFLESINSLLDGI